MSQTLNKQQVLAQLSLLIQTEGAGTVLMDLKEGFPREYDKLIGQAVMALSLQGKKGALLDAGISGCSSARVADPSTPEQRPDGDKRAKFRPGHPQPKSS